MGLNITTKSCIEPIQCYVMKLSIHFQKYSDFLYFYKMKGSNFHKKKRSSDGDIGKVNACLELQYSTYKVKIVFMILFRIQNNAF